MNTEAHISRLREFIGLLVKARIRSSDKWRRWKKKEENQRKVAELFLYEQLEGMPPITSVVKPFFHPELPLIGLNYTQVAHNVLHQFPSGWTAPLRLCRGIVFSRRGKLIALPFPKFFNDGEMEETRNLPDEPFEATLKHDGHLGIIFEYGGQIIATTRGSFLSKSSVLANEMIRTIGADWSRTFRKDVTVLAEVIHPDTEVIVDYEGMEAFILIGAYHRRTLQDFDYSRLKRLAKRLGIPVAETWRGDSIEALRKLMAERHYKNSEGYVVRFASGLRVKLKHAGYIGEMIRGKLTHTYVMQRLMSGTFEERFSDLDAEIQIEANRLKEEVLGVTKVAGSQRDRWKYLYSLLPEDQQKNQYRRNICRNFEKWMVSLLKDAVEGNSA